LFLCMRTNVERLPMSELLQEWIRMRSQQHNENYVTPDDNEYLKIQKLFRKKFYHLLWSWI
jgi:hypothetical protein